MTNLDDILAEINELAGKPIIRETDVKLSDLMRIWAPIGASTCRARMKSLVAQGLYVTMVVYDPMINRSVRIYRKVEQDAGPDQSST